MHYVVINCGLLLANIIIFERHEVFRPWNQSCNCEMCLAESIICTRTLPPLQRPHPRDKRLDPRLYNSDSQCMIIGSKCFIPLEILYFRRKHSADLFTKIVWHVWDRYVLELSDVVSMLGHVYDAGPELQQQQVNVYIVFVDSIICCSQCCFTAGPVP